MSPVDMYLLTLTSANSSRYVPVDPYLCQLQEICTCWPLPLMSPVDMYLLTLTSDESSRYVPVDPYLCQLQDFVPVDPYSADSRRYVQAYQPGLRFTWHYKPSATFAPDILVLSLCDLPEVTESATSSSLDFTSGSNLSHMYMSRTVQERES